MKMFWGSLFILVIFIVFSLYFTYILQVNTYELTTKIEKIQKEIEGGDWKEAEAQLLNFNKELEELIDLWKMFIDHDELDKIEISMARIKEYVSDENKTLSKSELSVMKFLIRHIYTNDKLSLKNVL